MTTREHVPGGQRCQYYPTKAHASVYCITTEIKLNSTAHLLLHYSKIVERFLLTRKVLA